MFIFLININTSIVNEYHFPISFLICSVANIGEWFMVSHQNEAIIYTQIWGQNASSKKDPIQLSVRTRNTKLRRMKFQHVARKPSRENITPLTPGFCV